MHNYYNYKKHNYNNDYATRTTTRLTYFRFLAKVRYDYLHMFCCLRTKLDECGFFEYVAMLNGNAHVLIPCVCGVCL